ncbi:hypothetical protein FCM30_05375 [Lelliottia aquatilis]|uniref:P-loop NTPase fold protein n=1 Tax=Lelliottia aquatilis TaxID=2080838 RepID=UPI001576E5E7|nr:P-loop NTPase fold protein [Lelliottia aquatilis]NTZ45197.1 hypothetical protein [Lelliottia aquatilis]
MKNKHVIEAISYYSQLDKPGYAILLTGEWGAGKTHLIKNNLKSYNYIYVSLFGLSSLDDIYASVYNAMHPRKGKLKNLTNNLKDVEVGFSGFTMGLGGMTNGLANSIMRENVENNKLIIFDDLERSCIKPDQILGAINKYVEHHECKVIAIAHDDKFGSKLTKTKEKIIGLTLKVIPDIPNSFKIFTDDFRFETLKSLFHDTFINIFIASECKSLRVLKHSIEDCVRLLDGLGEAVKNNAGATEEILSVFLALNIEVRTGTITENDLRNRSTQINNYTLLTIRMNNRTSVDDITPPTIHTISKKYKPVVIESNILSDDDLVNTLINGYFDFDSINKSALKSNYFLDKKERPSWNILYNFDTLDDITIEETVEKFDEEFESRHYTAIGEILHVFHFKFLMSSISASSLSFNEVESECKKYIDDLVDSDQLPNLKEDNFFSAPFNDSFGSLGFWLMDSYKENIIELRSYILSQQENMLKKDYPVISHDLLGLLENNPTCFCNLISYEYNKKGEYLEIDVLSSINPKKFVATWLKAPRASWNSIKDALEYRYGSGRLYTALAGEKIWFQTVVNELKEKLDSSHGFERYRIERILPLTIMYELENNA